MLRGRGQAIPGAALCTAARGQVTALLLRKLWSE
jgi:hypothetical protein